MYNVIVGYMTIIVNALPIGLNKKFHLRYRKIDVISIHLNCINFTSKAFTMMLKRQ